MKNVLSREERAIGLFQTAYQCEQFKSHGCRSNCGACQYNVSFYVEDPREAMLIKMDAARHNARTQEYKQQESAYNFICTFIVCAILFFCVYACNSCAAPPSETDPPAPPLAYTNLAWVKEQVKLNERDVNNDGVINCIDHGVIFYEYSPKPYTRIMVNKNDNGPPPERWTVG
ncbi:MAG: hypothetical protein LBJ31_09510 [Treponema sp.]|jgi:hypothetical protein|nr:hypothetical protein [Treponema sp.]